MPERVSVVGRNSSRTKEVRRANVRGHQHHHRRPCTANTDGRMTTYCAVHVHSKTMSVAKAKMRTRQRRWVMKATATTFRQLIMLPLCGRQPIVNGYLVSVVLTAAAAAIMMVKNKKQSTIQVTKHNISIAAHSSDIHGAAASTAVKAGAGQERQLESQRANAGDTNNNLTNRASSTGTIITHQQQLDDEEQHSD